VGWAYVGVRTLSWASAEWGGPTLAVLGLSWVGWSKTRAGGSKTRAGVSKGVWGVQNAWVVSRNGCRWVENGVLVAKRGAEGRNAWLGVQNGCWCGETRGWRSKRGGGGLRRGVGDRDARLGVAT